MLLVVTLMISGCTPTQPALKIGLLAPFEGLYRDSGYEALSAMRTAIADCAPAGSAIMPLALDTGSDPEQTRIAAGKLLTDPAMIGVVGPMSIAGALSVAHLMSTSNLAWFVPGLSPPELNNAASSDIEDWISTLIQAAPLTTTKRLIVSGPAETPISTINGAIAKLATEVAMLSEVDPFSLGASDTVIWLESAHTAAAQANVIAEYSLFPHLVMATPAGSDIFTAHALQDVRQQVDWLVSLDPEYNQWMHDHAPSSPTAYQTYRATCSMLMPPSSNETDAENGQWRIHRVRTDASGTWMFADNAVP